jgi:hypothetical protein
MLSNKAEGVPESVEISRRTNARHLSPFDRLLFLRLWVCIRRVCGKAVNLLGVHVRPLREATSGFRLIFLPDPQLRDLQSRQGVKTSF